MTSFALAREWNWNLLLPTLLFFFFRKHLLGFLVGAIKPLLTAHYAAGGSVSSCATKMHFSTTLHLLHHLVPVGTVFGLKCLQKSNLVPARSIPGLGRNKGMSPDKTKKRERRLEARIEVLYGKQQRNRGRRV